MINVKDEDLDIMFYDNSSWAGDHLRFSWLTGGVFYKYFKSVEENSGFEDWESALKWLNYVQPNKKIKTIQFWGHGTPGRVWINGECLSVRSFLASSPERYLLSKLKERLTPDSTVWFRCCNLFAGKEGKLFAKSLANFLNCRVAGHTFIVHGWQGGLHTVKPGQDPSWSESEGIKIKKDGSKEMLWTAPWSPNTIFCLTNEIPEGW